MRQLASLQTIQEFELLPATASPTAASRRRLQSGGTQHEDRE